MAKGMAKEGLKTLNGQQLANVTLEIISNLAIRSSCRRRFDNLEKDMIEFKGGY